MWWMWIVGPILVAVIYLVTGKPDKRRVREIELWRASWGPDIERIKTKETGYRKVDVQRSKERVEIGAKRAASLASDLAAAVADVADGQSLGTFELVPKNAYLGVYAAHVFSGSDHQALVCRLAEPGPTFVARPLPVVDGVRVPNHGVQFTKDPEFMAAYVVEGSDQKAIKQWLSPLVREQLLEMPDLWLRVNKSILTLTLFGRADAERLDDLVEAADVIYAEYGADGASLFGDASAASKPGAAPKSKKSGKPSAGEMAAIVEQELSAAKPSTKSKKA